MREIRIGVVQMRSLVGEPGRNLERIEAFAAEAARDQVEMLCFPELAVTGYAPGWTGFEPEPIPGPSTRALCRIAEGTSVTLLAGLLERGSDGGVYNAQVVVTPHGLEGVQRKTHVPESELAGFEPGDVIRVFDDRGIRFGIGVCFDAHFPELCSSLVGQGAELLFFPHASAGAETHDEKLARWSRFIPARACDNTVFVAACNQAGANGQGTDFVGGCLIIDPSGGVIVASRGPDEALISTVLRPELMERARCAIDGDFRRYRRPELYAVTP